MCHLSQVVFNPLQ